MARVKGTIHLKHANEYDPFNTKEALIMDALRKSKMLSDEFAYHAFDPYMMTFMQNHGTTHIKNGKTLDTIDCCILMPGPEGRLGIRHNDELGIVNYLEMNGTNDRGAIAVYWMAHLKGFAGGHPYYQFKHPERKREALAGCFLCKF